MWKALGGNRNKRMSSIRKRKEFKFRSQIGRKIKRMSGKWEARLNMSEKKKKRMESGWVLSRNNMEEGGKNM